VCEWLDEEPGHMCVCVCVCALHLLRLCVCLLTRARCWCCCFCSFVGVSVGHVGACLGILTKDGVVLATEKKIGTSG
jgi:hypothetical protein